MSKNIVKLKFSELDQFNLRPYGTCSTEAATAAKVVTCEDFVSLVEGATILVKFTYGNDINATLNVNNTGAKSIGECKWGAGDVLEFRYNGISWDIVAGVGGKSIENVTFAGADGLAKTYNINYTDNTSDQFVVTDGAPGIGIPGDPGRGISSITGPSTQGKIHTYTINYTDGTTDSFTVTDGVDGTGVTILGDYESEAALKQAHPSGELGDAYLVAGSLYVWTEETGWKNVGNIQGPRGEQGIQGVKGATFTPSVSSAGVISWTNDLGLTNPTSINIKGPKGDTGEQGPQGNPGIPGDPGKDGREITSITSDATETAGYTSTKVTVLFNEGEKEEFIVNAKNGSDAIAGDGKVTVKQNGKEVGSFTMNQSGNTTIELTDTTSTLTEIDPLFQASPAHAVTTSHVETLNDLEAGYITTENEVFQIVDSLDNIVTEFSGDGITTTKVQIGVSDNSPIITDTNITFNKTGEYDEVTTFINADEVITPSVTTPFFANIGGTSMFDASTLTVSDSNVVILEGSSINIYDSTPIVFEDDNSFSFADVAGKIITTIDGAGITASTISASTIKISGGTDDFVLLAGGGYTPLNEITAGLATENYVINKIAEAELAGGDVDLSGLATKDDLKKYLLLEGGTLSGDLIIQRGVSEAYLSNNELYFNNGGIGCDDPTSVNFYGFESSLSFGEGGLSNWTSQVSTIHSDVLTIGGVSGSEASIYLGHEQNNIISTIDQDSALNIWSAERISLNADGDGIYLNAPSVGFGEIMDISQSQVTLYNDTRLDFTGSGTTTMGPTETGFIISNDSELKLTSDTVCINAADLLEMYANGIVLNNVYINSSSEIVFDDNGTKLTQEELNFAYDCGTIKMEEDDVMRIYGEGGIRLDSPVTCISDISAAAFYETSDARKKDIKADLSLDKCYDLIDKCQTVIYSLKDQTKEQVGMIAQEIEEFFPEVVATDEEGFKSLAYDRLVVICFKVLKDVIKRLEKLENNGSN